MSFSPQVQALVDEGHITAEQAAAAEAAAPAPVDPSIINGRAVCLTPGCEMHGEPRPLQLRLAVSETRSLDLPVILSSSSYLTIVDESLLTCPECKLPSAMQPSAPPNYPKVLVV